MWCEQMSFHNFQQRLATRGVQELGTHVRAFLRREWKKSNNIPGRKEYEIYEKLCTVKSNQNKKRNHQMSSSWTNYTHKNYLQSTVHQGQEIRGTESVRQMGAFCGEEALTILTQYVLELSVLVESAEHTAQASEHVRLICLFVSVVWIIPWYHIIKNELRISDMMMLLMAECGVQNRE